MSDPRRSSDEFGGEALEPRLDARRCPLFRRRLLLERKVAEAAEDEPPVLGLLPVVVAVSRVVRTPEVLRLQGFGGHDLPTGRPHYAIERREEAVRVPIGRDNDLVRVELLDRRHRSVLTNLRTGIGGPNGKPPHPTGRVNRSIRRVEDPAVEAAGEAAVEIRSPFDFEAVGAQRLVLGEQRRCLPGVGRQAQAAGLPERVTGERREPLQRTFGQPPERRGTLGAELGTGDVVRRSCPAQCKAAVAATRTARDLTSLVHAHPEAGGGARQRARAAGNAGTLDRHVNAAVYAPLRDRGRIFLEPVRAFYVADASGATASPPGSSPPPRRRARRARAPRAQQRAAPARARSHAPTRLHWPHRRRDAQAPPSRPRPASTAEDAARPRARTARARLPSRSAALRPVEAADWCRSRGCL